LSANAQTVRDALASGGALFFGDLVTRTNLLASQVEEALSELAALGFVTSDSFDGLRALLVPSNKRPTLGRNEGKRRRKTNLASNPKKFGEHGIDYVKRSRPPEFARHSYAWIENRSLHGQSSFVSKRIAVGGFGSGRSPQTFRRGSFRFGN